MSREASMLLAVQRRTAGLRTLPVARLPGRAGEHAAGIAAGLVGAVLDSRARYPSDVLSGVALAGAVAAAAPVGRTVRRR